MQDPPGSRILALDRDAAEGGAASISLERGREDRARVSRAVPRTRGVDRARRSPRSRPIASSARRGPGPWPRGSRRRARWRRSGSVSSPPRSGDGPSGAKPARAARRRGRASAKRTHHASSATRAWAAARWLGRRATRRGTPPRSPGTGSQSEALRRGRLLTSDAEVLDRRIVGDGSLVVAWVPSALTVAEQLHVVAVELVSRSASRGAWPAAAGSSPRKRRWLRAFRPAPRSGRTSTRLRGVRSPLLARHALGADLEGAAAVGGGVSAATS